MPTRYNGEILELQAELRSLGLAEAKSDRPATAATHADQNESKLASGAERFIAEEQRAFDEAVAEANRSLIQLQTDVVRLGTDIHQALTDADLAVGIDADKAAVSADLGAAVVQRKHVERDYRHFRAVHQITDEPVYPESHIWHFGVVAVLALIETAVNAFFYENAQGLLGGFTVALGVSVVNMFGALFLGIGFRYRNLSGLDQRVLGWSCLLLFVFLSLYCNALFAAFRSEYQLLLDPSKPDELRGAFARADDTAREILVLQSKFPDFLSFILFFIGLLLSALAFWKGYTFDDRYPGHGRRHRALVAARMREQAGKESFRSRVRDTYHRSRLNLQGIQGSSSQLIGRVASRRGDLEGAALMLTQKAAAIQRDYATVLGAYRQANLSVRVTQAPSYFNVTPDVGAKADNLHARPLLDALGEVRRDIERLQSESSKQLAEKISLQDAEKSRILREIDTGFFLEIERDAEASINATVLTIRTQPSP